VVDLVTAAPTRKRSRVARFLTDQTKWTPYLFVAPFFITFAIFTLYPMLRAVIMGFQTSLGYTGLWEWVGFENYVEALTNDARMITSLRNFVYFTLGSLLTQLPVAFLLALLLTARPLRAKGVWRTLFFIPSVLPGVTMGVIGLWFFSKTHGFANALVVGFGGQRIDWGGFTHFIMPQLLTIAFWQWMGNHAVFLIAGMSGISAEVIEASIMDGATAWQRARHIVLPLLKPVFAYISITAAAGSLMNFDVPFVLFDSGGGPRNQGWFFMTHIREMAFRQFRMGYATAIGWLVFFIAIVITVLQFRVYDFKLGQEEV
jgi:ABC-type sugar transport system permease subunit